MLLWRTDKSRNETDTCVYVYAISKWIELGSPSPRPQHPGLSSSIRFKVMYVQRHLFQFINNHHHHQPPFKRHFYVFNIFLIHFLWHLQLKDHFFTIGKKWLSLVGDYVELCRRFHYDCHCWCHHRWHRHNTTSVAKTAVIVAIDATITTAAAVSTPTAAISIRQPSSLNDFYLRW